MKRYFIETVRCGVSNGGMACGPIEGSVVVTVKIKEDGETKWISMVECMGFPNVYVTDKDVFEDLVKEDFKNEEIWEYIKEHYVESFNGIATCAEYGDILDSISEDPENPAVPLIRYMIAVVRCDYDVLDELIAMAEGKYADELENIPVSDIEEDILWDLECEEDEYDDEDE